MYFLLVISSRYRSYVYILCRWMFNFLLGEKLCHYGGMYVSSRCKTNHLLVSYIRFATTKITSTTFRGNFLHASYIQQHEKLVSTDLSGSFTTFQLIQLSFRNVEFKISFVENSSRHEFKISNLVSHNFNPNPTTIPPFTATLSSSCTDRNTRVKIIKNKSDFIKR